MRRFGNGEAQPSRSKVFEIPGHELLVSGHEGAWRVTVDGVAESPLVFATEAEAWAAGVREAERLDRGLEAGAFPGP
ncbi:MAG TPA: hypothetical protein VLD85_12850 [Anaeromyxobacteraceae bacterium]|nr:hypothetical protein [Anaeromyxobacteraceae bacterium]